MTAAPAPPDPDDILHASCVAHCDKAVLIRGTSGSGKSALTLQLIGLGARLIADDRTCVRRRQRGVIAYAPHALLGLIETRGVGILQCDVAPPTPIALIIDLDHEETERMPLARSCDVLGQSFPLLRKVNGPHFASAVLQYLQVGPWTPR